MGRIVISDCAISGIGAMKRPRMKWRNGTTVTMRCAPIEDVLAKIPGKTLADKARTAKVSKQLMWLWKQGQTRPSWKNAQRLAKITGIPAADIAGQFVEDK